MDLLLYSNGVITLNEKEVINQKVYHEKMGYLIVKVIIQSLLTGCSKKYKLFLKAMEDSEDLTLHSTAKNLGKLIHMHMYVYCLD